jgi:hypothetical protein
MVDDLQQRLAALEERVTALTAEVHELRRGLEAARGHIDLTMRKQLRCPACGGASILHVGRIRDHRFGEAFAAMAIQLTQGILKTTIIGEFELYVCRACGLGEWYVKDAGAIKLEGLDKQNREHVRIIDNTREPAGPYR